MTDTELKLKIEKYIDEHEAELLSDVVDLCRINSVRTEKTEHAPYGSGAKRALIEAERLCESYGFKTKLYSDRVISADMNSGESCLDILAHIDVVAAGDGWTVTEPFEPIIKNGAIYGRGTSDDKGPAMAALYAMRAVKELGIDINKNCRLILGSDEECGSSDIPYYYAEEKAAPMTFSPDGEFPVINIEKGQFRGEVVSYLKGNDDTKASGTDCSMGSASAESLSDAEHSAESGRRLIEFKSGDTINIVPGKGYARVTGFCEEEIKRAVSVMTGQLFGEKAGDVKISCTRERTEGGGDIDRIDVIGRTAHASTPETGINAGVVLLNILTELKFDDEQLNSRLSELKSMFPYGDFYGEGLGISLSDPESGATTLTPDIFVIDGEHISVRFDSRTCIIAEEANTILKAAQFIEEKGFSFEYSFVPPHVVSADSDFVKTLLDTYTLVSGKEGYCVALGGGTYVHDIENGVAFGAVGESTDTRMHGPNEFMLISELKQAAVIYALCIARLCR